MTQISKHEPGTFCWAELGTTDSAAAKKFYGGLFGWGSSDIPMGEQGNYTMFQKEGDDVGATYTMGPQQKGVPPHWLTYVSVESADEAAKKAKASGGTVVMEPFDVFDQGRMALLQDPTGATFGVWQPKAGIGAKRWNEPNAVCWTELLTDDTGKAKQFYGDVFGWGSKIGGDYTEFQKGKDSFAGMMAIRKEWGPMPPNWGIYVLVEDPDATAKKAAELGGKVVVPPTDIPEVGRFATLADPQGAHFSVIKLSPKQGH
jgi:predicted enzyme related to lactoylglutathione lyase